MSHEEPYRPTAKVLFLGDNSQSTDQQISDLAKQHDVINHGIILNSDFGPDLSGYYHTTVVDIPWGDLIVLAQRFDTIVMLDQPQISWSHWKCLQATFKLMVKLEQLGQHTVFRNNQNIKKILYWSDLVHKENKSFCIYPWINFFADGNQLKLCSRANDTVTTIDQFQGWTADPNYTQIRNNMLQGQQLPNHCSMCYNYEDHGIESYRQFETMDWVMQLNLQDVQDLAQLQRPYFYEVDTGNHCNIKCRGCVPKHSAPIGKEFKKFNITFPGDISWVPPASSIDQIDIDTLDSKTSVYFQGGEPTIMPEVLDFMKQCIAKNQTDFNLTMCTNGVKISQEFQEVVANFPNTNFSFSLDGYGKVNDYWRSGSQWDRVIANAHRLQSQGHSISINTVPGIYNVTNLHLLFEFLDREFPFTAIYLQVNYLPWQSAFNHPFKDMVIESMQKCMQTSIYHSNGKSCKSTIDSIYDHYSNDPVCDVKSLGDFFAFNDQLDSVRGTKLADYIPELEAARSYTI
jgi:sulfatase maturation enzyme AslB (radical SAM superfamily)